MKRLSHEEKLEALRNALATYNLDSRYRIVKDQIDGKRFAIADKDERYLNVKSNYMTYEEMNAYFFGYQLAIKENL